MSLLEDAIKEIVSKVKSTEWKLYRDEACTDEIESHSFLAILNQDDGSWSKVISDITIQQLTGEQDE